MNLVHERLLFLPTALRNFERQVALKPEITVDRRIICSW